MKKLTVLLLCLAMLCLPAAAEEADMTGVWYLFNVEMDGVSMNPADMGMEMTFEFNSDGTGVNGLTGMGSAEIEWVLEDGILSVITEETVTELSVTEDGCLLDSDEENGLNLYFGREKPVASFIPAAPVAAEDPAQFNGVWTAEICNFYGAIMPFSELEAIGMTNPSITIEDGVVSKFGEPAETAVFENGVLSIVSTEEDDDDNLFGSTITLLEDGTLQIFYLGITFYTGAPT